MQLIIQTQPSQFHTALSDSPFTTPASLPDEINEDMDANMLPNILYSLAFDHLFQQGAEGMLYGLSYYKPLSKIDHGIFQSCHRILWTSLVN